MYSYVILYPYNKHCSRLTNSKQVVVALTFKWNPMIVVDVPTEQLQYRLYLYTVVVVVDGRDEGMRRQQTRVNDDYFGISTKVVVGLETALRIYIYIYTNVPRTQVYKRTRWVGQFVRTRWGMKSVFGPMEWVCLLRRGWAERRRHQGGGRGVKMSARAA